MLLEEGLPLLFGEEKEKALNVHEDQFTFVTSKEENLYIHDSNNFINAMRLARLSFPAYPVPLGVYYQKPRDIFALQQNVKKSVSDLPALFRAKASWQQN